MKSLKSWSKLLTSSLGLAKQKPKPSVIEETTTEDESASLLGARLRRNRTIKKSVRLPALSEKFESLNYELIENEVQRREEESQRNWSLVATRNRNRWIACFLIGLVTALIGVIVYSVVKAGSYAKNLFLSDAFEHCTEQNCIGSVFLYWSSINLLFVFIPALLCVYLAPVAAGSGIPQIKCFLNGIKVPQLLRASTLFTKIVGVIGSTLGGLAIGKEGPMAHAGACVAGGVSQGRSLTFPIDFKIFEYFRSDREKRDFVSAGTAAGVAAAFNAPIGGVLFAMEEGASFWSQMVTWRTFFCSMTCYFFLNLALTTMYEKRLGLLSWNGLANFGLLTNDMEYAVWEIPVFVLMGIIGGLNGALFNAFNGRVTLFRQKYMKEKWKKVAEVVWLSILGATFSTVFLSLTEHCVPIDTFNREYSFLTFPVRLYCPEGYVNELATFIFDSPEAAVRWFIHFPERGFDIYGLMLYVPCYWLLAGLTYGASVPSGIFVPLLLIGAGWGRMTAWAMQVITPSTKILAITSKYAIVGAGAQLSGSLRMTISLCVILMESVQSLKIGMPLMISMMVAKWVGDHFNKGLYDMHIDLLEIPLLGWHPPEKASTVPAREVMSTPVSVIRTREKVGNVLNILRENFHNGYPVVSDFTPEDRLGRFNPWTESWDEPTSFGQLEGFIMRYQLIVLLRNRAFSPSWASRLNILEMEPVLTSEHFRDPYPRYDHTLEQLQLSEEDLDSWLDLRPYMDRAPYITTQDSSLRKLFRLCRLLGLRHVVVVDKEHRVLGIVTRKDVAKYREVIDKEKNTFRVREMKISKRTDNDNL